jgi:hypothetical protein
MTLSSTMCVGQIPDADMVSGIVQNIRSDYGSMTGRDVNVHLFRLYGIRLGTFCVQPVNPQSELGSLARQCTIGDSPFRPSIQVTAMDEPAETEIAARSRGGTRLALLPTSLLFVLVNAPRAY